jgi:hypothetical protein
MATSSKLLKMAGSPPVVHAADRSPSALELESLQTKAMRLLSVVRGGVKARDSKRCQPEEGSVGVQTLMKKIFHHRPRPKISTVDNRGVGHLLSKIVTDQPIPMMTI